MYSMKRISAPSRAASCTRGPISSSFTPRMSTVSILKPGNTRAAASSPSRTRGSSSDRVSAVNRAASSVSRLTVIRCSPAAFSAFAIGASRMPLVVSATSSHGTAATSCAISTGRSRRNSGSPPVRRRREAPAATKHAGQPCRLVEIEDVFARQPGVLGFRHAVVTSQVAAVGDRQPQARQRAREPVEGRHDSSRATRRALASEKLASTRSTREARASAIQARSVAGAQYWSKAAISCRAIRSADWPSICRRSIMNTSWPSCSSATEGELGG